MLEIGNARKYTISFGATAAFLLLTISLFSDHWLNQRAAWTVSVHAAGLMFRSTPVNESVVIKKEMYSYSGLWRICCGEAICAGRCKILDALTAEVESRTLSSLYVINMLRRSNIFPIVSVFLAFFATVLLGFSYIRSSKKLTFPIIGGVFFVLSGLSNVLGIIIYISSSDKLSKNKTPDTFYGWSFYFSGIGFLLAEILGVMVIQDIVKIISSVNEEREGEDDESMDGTKDRRRSSGGNRINCNIPPSASLRRSFRRASVKRMGDNNFVIDSKLVHQLQRLHKKIIKECSDDSDHSQQSSPEKINTAAARPCRYEETPGLPYSDSGYHDMSPNDAHLECAEVGAPYLSGQNHATLIRSGSLDDLISTTTKNTNLPSRIARSRERYSDHLINYKSKKTLTKTGNNWSLENDASASKDEIYSVGSMLHSLPPPDGFTTDNTEPEHSSYRTYSGKYENDNQIQEYDGQVNRSSTSVHGQKVYPRKIDRRDLQPRSKMEDGRLSTGPRSVHSRFLHQLDKSGKTSRSVDFPVSSSPAPSKSSSGAYSKANGYLKKIKETISTPIKSQQSKSSVNLDHSSGSSEFKIRAGKAKKKWPRAKNSVLCQSIDLPQVGSIDEGHFSDLADYANHLSPATKTLTLPTGRSNPCLGSTDQIYYESRPLSYGQPSMHPYPTQDYQCQDVRYLAQDGVTNTSSRLHHSHRHLNVTTPNPLARCSSSLSVCEQPPPYHNVRRTPRYTDIPLREFKQRPNGDPLANGGITAL